MKKILTAAQMKYADDYTIKALHMPSIVLMERAAIGACDAIVERFSPDTKISIICGSGNNGGDGMAIARILTQRGMNVKWHLYGDYKKLSEQAKIQWDILSGYGYKQSNFSEILDCDLLVDAIFGIGLSRNLNKEYIAVIDKLNSLPCKKLAIDIPSGINSSNGKIMGSALRCDYTVTFAYEKLGHHLYRGRDYCGKIIIKIIGITEESLPKTQKFVTAYEKDDFLPLLPLRTSDSHKGTYGRVLIIAGTRDMAGAAYLAAKAAYLSGAGLVKILTEECNRVILQQLLPEAMLSTYEKTASKSLISKELSWATTVLIGPALGLTEDKQEILDYVIKNCVVPLVIDADALSLIAKDLSLFKEAKSEIVITPHIGEMSRLINEQVFDVLSDLPKTARDFAKEHNCICVLKSASTLISTPKKEVYLNLYGNNGMSTGGSGDVLSGMIAGFIAQKCSPINASILGVGVHSLAGDYAKDTIGSYSMKAEDILTGESHILKEMAEKNGN